MYLEAASTNLEYVEQEAGSLRLCVYPGDLSSHTFHTIAAQDAAWHGFQADFHVIGASHAVTFTAGGTAITEILACFDPEANPVTPLLAGPSLAETSRHREMEPAAAEGACYYRFDSLPVRINHFLAKRAARHGRGEHALCVAFPARPRAVSPFTFLAWQTSPEGLGIYSIHTYPADDIAVCSRSSFSCVPLSGHIAAVPEGMPEVAAALSTEA